MYKVSKCSYCKKNVDAKQIFRFEYKKQNKFIDLCPKCGTDFYNKNIKELDVNRQVLQSTGLYKLGANATDVKMELQKWTKRNIMK